MPHTPGPWQLDRYVDSGNPNPGSIVALDPHGDGDEQVCSVTHWFGDFQSECGANAQLIAAAPDMLAALQYIVAWKPDGWNGTTARDMARAAIAKAIG